jgi:branched-chain amino acid transport system ATP-binding protein
MSALVLDRVSKSFGGMVVISNLSLTIVDGARHAVIGPNGAGKTTLFNLITGWLRPNSGTIWLNDLQVTRMEPYELPHRGLARSFQRNALMTGLTVSENLRLAAQAVHSSRYHLFANSNAFPDVIAAARMAAQLMGLTDLLDRKVSELSYGQKRQLEVAMPLTSRPRVLLLDEPAAGTSPDERAALIRLINELPRDVTLLLVEHDMDVVFEVCDMITVLSYGEVLASGTPAEVRADDRVRTAYLGMSRHA